MFKRGLMAYLLVSCSLLERADDFPTKTGAQFSRCGKGMNLRNLL